MENIMVKHGETPQSTINQCCSATAFFAVPLGNNVAPPAQPKQCRKAVLLHLQGRQITPTDIQLIQQLLADNPSWGRTQLSRELCKVWQWYNPRGQMKDMACRSLLLKLEEADYIKLPPRQQKLRNTSPSGPRPFVSHETEELNSNLKLLLPLCITEVVQGSDESALFNCLLSHYHYLGYKRTVGENMKYLIRSCAGRPLACVLLGSAAWKTAPRDTFIGWDREMREKNLEYITNNTRFLILPWVRVPYLASHILSLISRRISSDWMKRYGHPIYLLETFVDRSRFRGTCYKAANWILVGQTKGRTRNDRNNTIKVPIKDIYVYSLTRKFRKELCYDA